MTEERIEIDRLTEENARLRDLLDKRITYERMTTVEIINYLTSQLKFSKMDRLAELANEILPNSIKVKYDPMGRDSDSDVFVIATTPSLDKL